jgi:hypothetical protein
MRCKPPMVEYSSCKFDPPRLFKIKQICANTICVVNVHILSMYFFTFMEPRNRFQGINSASLCSLAYLVPRPHRPFNNSSSEALNKQKWKTCLFVETMPIYKAVATGNRNMSCTEKHVQTGNNPRLPQCQTIAE